jgi:hypothetical protein
MGMGYVEPHEFGLSRKDFQKIYTEWETKLKASGFNDIEYRSASHTGHFTPFFRSNGSTATFQALYDPAKAEYYLLATHFDAWMHEKLGNHTRWGRAFRGSSAVYKQLWYLHIEGVPYRAVAKIFSGIPTKYANGLKPIAKGLVQSRSVFWAHTHTDLVLDLFWMWARDQGYNLDPRTQRVSRGPRKPKLTPQTP